jgi:hypothetical protein
MIVAEGGKHGEFSKKHSIAIRNMLPFAIGVHEMQWPDSPGELSGHLPQNVR